MCICVAYCLVDWALTTIVETQPIVQKYSKEGEYEENEDEEKEKEEEEKEKEEKEKQEKQEEYGVNGAWSSAGMV